MHSAVQNTMEVDRADCKNASKSLDNTCSSPIRPLLNLRHNDAALPSVSNENDALLVTPGIDKQQRENDLSLRSMRAAMTISECLSEVVSPSHRII